MTTRLERALSIVSTVAMLVAAVVMTMVGARSLLGESPGAPTPTAGPLPEKELQVAGSPVRGSVSARLAVIVFSDFQCPVCAQFAARMEASLGSQLQSGEVMVVFRHRPLLSIHPLARKAAIAAECAHSIGAFWEFHDRAFSGGALTEGRIQTEAASVGVSVAQQEACAYGPEVERVKRDEAEAELLQIHSTPTIIVGYLTVKGTVRATERFDGLVGSARLEKALSDAAAASDR